MCRCQLMSKSEHVHWPHFFNVHFQLLLSGSSSFSSLKDCPFFLDFFKISKFSLDHRVVFSFYSAFWIFFHFSKFVSIFFSSVFYIFIQIGSTKTVWNFPLNYFNICYWFLKEILFFWLYFPFFASKTLQISFCVMNPSSWHGSIDIKAKKLSEILLEKWTKFNENFLIRVHFLFSVRTSPSWIVWMRIYWTKSIRMCFTSNSQVGCSTESKAEKSTNTKKTKIEHDYQSDENWTKNDNKNKCKFCFNRRKSFYFKPSLNCERIKK